MVKIYLILMALFGLTAGLAQIDLGAWNTPLAILIAVAKAGLILYYFMELRASRKVVHVAAAAGFFWLGILFVMTLTDYMSRGWYHLVGK